MILSGPEIKKEYTSGMIHINPFRDDMINPNSYNYRISNQLYEVIDSPLDAHKKSTVRKVNFGKNGYVLQPNRLYLSTTFEEIGSDEYVVSLIGRSSLGRLGLFLQITADMSQLGSKHQWTLELYVVQPLRIYPGMRIGQVSFWSVAGDTSLTNKDNKALYTRYSVPMPSQYYKRNQP